MCNECITWESLAKENEGRVATDQEFAVGLGISFYFGETKQFAYRINSETGQPEAIITFSDAMMLLQCAWGQLRHAYGFYTDGSCNSKHLAQIVKEAEDEVELINRVDESIQNPQN